MATITIPKNLIKEVDKTAKNFGLSKEDFLVGAILYYLKQINEKIELKKELEAWEKASDEDFLKFEQKI